MEEAEQIAAPEAALPPRRCLSGLCICAEKEWREGESEGIRTRARDSSWLISTSDF